MPHTKAVTAKAISEYWDRLVILAAWRIILAAIFFKHKAYSNEQEYRFLEICDVGVVPEIKYRDRPYTLVRYKEFDWRGVAPNSLKKIVIGPASAEDEKAWRFAKDCLRVFHAGAVDVSRSDIPYRAT
jgi:hypothetical protein